MLVDHLVEIDWSAYGQAVEWNYLTSMEAGSAATAQRVVGNDLQRWQFEGQHGDRLSRRPLNSRTSGLWRRSGRRWSVDSGSASSARSKTPGSPART